MKKFIKWFLFLTFVCGCFALAICYMVIPERTKCAIDILVGYLNTPLGTIFGTTITLGLVVGVIIKVVVDRYRKNIKADLEEHKEQVQTLVNKAKDYEELANKYFSKLEEQNNILKAYVDNIDDMNNEFLIKLCETVPNKKVKELARQFLKEENNNEKAEERTND